MATNLEAELYQLLSDLTSLSATNINNNVQLAIDNGTLNISQADAKNLHAVVNSTLKSNVDIAHVQITKLVNTNASSKTKKARTKKS